MNPLQGKLVIALLLERWWMLTDLALALGVQRKLALWYVQQTARGRVVFARRTPERQGARGPKPMEYRVFREAVSVQRARKRVSQ